MHDAGREGVRRRVWAAVPFRGPVGSKRRLAGLLSEDERARLSLAMLGGVLRALLGVNGIERVLLLRPAPGSAAVNSRGAAPAASPNGGGPQVSNWRAPRRLLDDERLTVVDEDDSHGQRPGRDTLNRAVVQAQALAAEGGAEALLIVPADLPLIRADDLVAVLEAAATAQAVIAPDRAGNGTNALLIAPPVAIEPSFGEASFERHRALAEAADLNLAVVERLGLGLDLDTPADVALLLATDQESPAARLLRELGAVDRLDRLAAAQARSTTI